jgi:hypothetical protein
MCEATKHRKTVSLSFLLATCLHISPNLLRVNALPANSTVIPSNSTLDYDHKRGGPFAQKMVYVSIPHNQR